MQGAMRPAPARTATAKKGVRVFRPASCRHVGSVCKFIVVGVNLVDGEIYDPTRQPDRGLKSLLSVIVYSVCKVIAGRVSWNDVESYYLPNQLGRLVDLPLNATAPVRAQMQIYNLTRQLGRGANLPLNATAWSVHRFMVERVSLADVTIYHPTC